jgi:hypothetical protein
MLGDPSGRYHNGGISQCTGSGREKPLNLVMCGSPQSVKV